VRKTSLVVVTVTAVVLLTAGPAPACSTFCLDAAGTAGPIFGKNYDWDVPDGLVIVNKRNVTKTGMTFDNPARWTSTYGSVTFNQYGRELPCGGMNEAGLVIELMWLDETQYPPPDDRPSVQNLQWIQYHLDRSATVAEVIAGDADVRITGDDQASVHFLVADRTGACAAIEFIGGVMTVHAGDSLPAPVLTNDTYDNSAAYLETHVGFGGAAPVPQSRRSLDRFVRAAAAVSEFDPDAGDSAVDYAFGILASVAQGEFTKWSIVYDLSGLQVSFRTRGNPGTRRIDLGRLDFSCATPVRIIDIDADLSGDITDLLLPYTLEANRALVDSAFAKTPFLADTPPSVLEYLAQYPESTPCEQKLRSP
jgi:choloylglycine hydrolase